MLECCFNKTTHHPINLECRFNKTTHHVIIIGKRSGEESQPGPERQRKTSCVCYGILPGVSDFNENSTPLLSLSSFEIDATDELKRRGVRAGKPAHTRKGNQTDSVQWEAGRVSVGARGEQVESRGGGLTVVRCFIVAVGFIEKTRSESRGAGIPCNL